MIHDDETHNSKGHRVNYFPFFPGDYLRDTSDLSLEHHGAYLLLLCHYYMHGNLPQNPLGLYRVSRSVTEAEQKITDWVLDRFFPLNEDNRRVNERADLEIAKANKKIEAARANGVHGGRPPKKPSNNPAHNPGANLNGTQQESYPDPSPSKSKKKEQPQAAFAIPSWIKPEVWQGFAEMRKKKRAPLTVRACAMVCTELIKLRDAGNEPNAVLDQSTRNSWTDVYALKTGGINGTHKEGHAERVERKLREGWAKVAAERDGALRVVEDGGDVRTPLDVAVRRVTDE